MALVDNTGSPLIAVGIESPPPSILCTPGSIPSSVF